MAAPGTAFDDDAKPIQAVEFLYPDEPATAEPTAEDDTAERTAFDRRQAAAAILEILTTGATVRQAGQRAFVLAYSLKLSPCRTQKELAGQLRISPGRVSQILNDVKGPLTPLALRQTAPRTLKTKLPR